MKGQDTMVLNGKRQRERREISRLSAQTRQKAWVEFTDLKRKGIDEAAALEKALQHACPSKDDPYYHWYYPNKRRELRLWEKHGLWPLSRPKDIEHDTGPHDSVEISPDVADMMIGDAEALHSKPQVLQPQGSSQQRLDTVDFDPMEVARIIEEYEVTGECALLSGEESEDEGPTVTWDRPPAQNQRHGPPAAREVEEAIMTLRPQEEAERIVRNFFDGDTLEVPQADLELTQEVLVSLASQASLVVGGLKLTVDDLMAMLEWWRHRGAPSAEPIFIPPIRPHFRRDAMVSKTVELNADICAAAEAKAKELATTTGGSFSGLVEYLLWKHLGCDNKYLKE